MQSELSVKRAHLKHFYLESLEFCKLQEYSKDVVRAMQGPYIFYNCSYENDC